MPSSLNGTGVTFNDATTQSTANNLPANTTNVLAATASASVGDVGTYAFLGDILRVTTAPGGTRAGSNLRFAGLGKNGAWNTSLNISVNAANVAYNNTPSGTWRCMGDAVAQNGNPGYTSDSFPLAVWLRIS